MTQIDLSKVQFSSKFSGLGAKPGTTLSKSFSSHSVDGTTGTPVVLTASKALSDTDLLTQVEVQFTNLDSKWYIFKGHLENFYTSGNVWTNNLLSAQYSITVDTSYSGNALIATITLTSFNLDSVITVPAFIFNCNISQYVAPFS